MTTGNRKFDVFFSIFLGAAGGLAFYLAALAVSRTAGVATTPVVAGAFGVLGIAYVVARRAARNARLENTWTSDQKSAALSEHTLVVLTDAKGRICEANRKLLDLTGWDRDDLIGASETKLIAVDDLPGYTKAWAALRRLESWTGASSLRCKDGSEVCTDLTMIPRTDTCGNMDGHISIRTRSVDADALDDNRNLVSILKRLRDEVYIFNAETLTFSYLNDAALRNVGWSEDKIAEKSLKDLTQGFDEARFRVMAQPLLSGEEQQIRRTVVFKGRAFDADLQLIRNEAEADQFVCVMRDAAGRIENERLKSELISTVSHELRSPMTSIKGAMGLVLSGAAGELPEKAHGMLEIAHRNADRLVLLINDILDIEKLDAGAMAFDNRDRDMAETIREAVEAIGPYATRFDVKVDTTGLDKPVMACFDQARMMQVMTNLLSNAAKFSPPGGRVEVALSATGTTLRVEVRDQGPGIPADKQEQIFKRFSRLSSDTNSKTRSTGLGLNIVKTIVEKQGGTVGVDTVEGEGSTFWFDLPLAQAEDRPARRAAAG